MASHYRNRSFTAMIVGSNGSVDQSYCSRAGRRANATRPFAAKRLAASALIAAATLGPTAPGVLANDFTPIGYEEVDPFGRVGQSLYPEYQDAELLDMRFEHRLHVANVDHPMGQLTFAMWDGYGVCGLSNCGIKIFLDEDWMGGAETCADPADHLIDSSGEFVRLCSSTSRPVVNLFWQSPPRHAINTLVQWQSEDVQRLNHNGSVMAIDPASGTIRYEHVREGLRHLIDDGALLFRGEPWNAGGPFEGTAFTFRTGCEPAPYEVTAGYENYEETLVLRGSAPVRASSGCEVVSHDPASANSELRFDWTFG